MDFLIKLKFRSLEPFIIGSHTRALTQTIIIVLELKLMLYSIPK